MNRGALFAVVVAGIALAVWHASVAMEAIFVFRNNEPITSWLALALGPALTLAGCVLAVFRRLAGGLTVVAGGVLSAVAFLIGEGGITEYVTPYLLKFTVPMLVIGVGLIGLARWPVAESTDHAT
jgi:hypothetical protein